MASSPDAGKTIPAQAVADSRDGTQDVMSGLTLLPRDVARVNNAIIKELKDELRAERLVIITGAGVTINALTDENGNYPSYAGWDGLIENGFNYLENTVDLNDDQRFYVKQARENARRKDLKGLLNAATTLKEELSNHDQYATWLNSVFEPLEKEVRHWAILDNLKKLHDRKAILLTTNYDDLLDKWCKLKSLDASTEKQVQDFRFRKPLESVFHIHGHYENPEVVVLTRVDYFAVQRPEFPHSTMVRAVVETFLETKTILFVGAGSGLNDPNFHALLDWARKRQKDRKHNHCVLVLKDEKTPNSFLRPVIYGSKHKDLAPFLEILLEDVQGGAPSAGEPMNENTSEIQVERSKILQWLERVDQIDHHDDTLSEHATGTGSWFLQKEFKEWFEKPSSLLWLYGSVGCGKSVLASLVIKKVGESFLKPRSLSARHSMAYFYFSFADKRTLDFRNLLKTLIWQLCPNDRIPDVLRTIYKSCLQLNQSKPTMPQMREGLLCMLERPCLRHVERSSSEALASCKECDTVSKTASTYLIFDGVDEIPDGLQREPFLRLIRDIASADLPHIHILITSRDQYSIATALRASPRCRSVEMEPKVVEPDIRSYVEESIEGGDRLRLQSPDTKAFVVRRLLGLKPADGMFRWTALQMKALKNLKPLDKQKIHKTLKNLPKDLEEAYGRMLTSIDDADDSELALRALRWIVCSTRQLYIEEVVDACALTSDGSSTEPRLSDMRRGGHSFHELLEDLIVIRPPLLIGSDLSASRTHVVSLAHFSVEEYLTGDKIAKSAASSYRIENDTSHRFLARSCFGYLYCCNTYEHRDGEFPLRRYAWYNWEHHVVLRKVEGGDLTRSIAKSLYKRLSSDLDSPRTNHDHGQGVPLLTEIGMKGDWLNPINRARLLLALREPFFFERYEEYQKPEPQSENGSQSSSDYSQYEPLYDGSQYVKLQYRDIRLVTVLPGLDLDDSPIIKANLENVSLDQLPPFEAVSYVWGHERGNIWIKGMPTVVSSSLAEALTDLAHGQEHRTRRLWIDQLSINQDDHVEKNHQIPLMPEIFKKADNVLVIFGRQSHMDREGAEFLRLLATSLSSPIKHKLNTVQQHADLTCADVPNHRWNWVLLLFQHQWWTRVWILQEIILAQNVTLTFGDNAVSFEVLEDIYRNLDCLKEAVDSSKCHCKRGDCAKKVSEEFLRSPGLYSAGQMFIVRSLLREGRVITLPQLLEAFQFHRVTNPRDRIYGFLALISDQERQSQDLQVDYNFTIPYVFTRLARHLILECHTLDLLSWVSHWPRKGTPKSWPKWVPDHTPPWNRKPLVLGKFSIPIQDRVYCAGGLLPNATIVVAEAPAVLVSDGIEYDTIGYTTSLDIPDHGSGRGDSVTSFVQHIHAPSHVPGIQQMKRRFEENHPTSSFNIAFWRSILADQDGRGHRLDLLIDQNDQTDDLLSSKLKDVAKSTDLEIVIGRQIFVSEKGHIGLIPIEAQIGDTIVIIPGGDVPFVLRKKDWRDLRYPSNSRGSGRSLLSPEDGGGSQHSLDHLPHNQSRHHFEHPRKRKKVDPVENSGSKVLRETSAPGEDLEHPYDFVGECYVHGIMDGEVMQELEDGKHRLESLWIY